MTAQRRKHLLLAVLVTLLAVLAGWAYGRYTVAKADAVRACADLAVCRSIASRIQGSRNKPNLAEAQELQLAVLARQVELAAKAALIAPDRVARIWPEPARRVEDTVYKEKPTQILLKDVSMRQIVVFLHTLTTSTSGLWAKSLRLSASRGPEIQDSWSAEVVVTYLIYAPPKAVQASAEDRGI